MKSRSKLTGAALAITAATLFATAPMTLSAGSHWGKCTGVNACKGQSDCSTSTNSCKGENSCKGKGFIEMSKADCDTAGGDFT